MLILSRKKDESIIIDGNIEVKVLGIENGKVQIGIEAPRQIDIFRQELYESIEEENRQAAKTKVDINKIGQLLKKNK